VGDLIAWLLEEDLKLFQERLRSCPRVWANLQQQEDKGFAPDTIPGTVAFTNELVGLFSAIAWEQVPPHVPRHFEFVTAVRVDGNVQAEHIKEIVKAAVAGNSVLGQRAATFYGFDIVEWPSNWSVPAHSPQWSAAGLALNPYHLCPDWQAGEKVWESYLAVHDPERGPLDAYRRLGVGSLGRGVG